jgi:hypothetical protein
MLLLGNHLSPLVHFSFAFYRDLIRLFIIIDKEYILLTMLFQGDLAPIVG